MTSKKSPNALRVPNASAPPRTPNLRNTNSALALTNHTTQTRNNNNGPNAKTARPLNNSVLMRVDPDKAEKYRREGELRLKEQLLKEEQLKRTEKKTNKKIKKEEKKKKAEDDSWWNTIKDVGGEVLKYGLPLLLGMGDYAEDEKILKPQEVLPDSNSLLAITSNGSAGTAVPIMHTSGNKIRIQHREYIGDIYSTTQEFLTFDYPINPGMNETNPWAAPIANQFTGYNYLGANAVFVSEGSEYSNSVGLGYVAMAYQYNVTDATFDSKRDMLNSQFAVSTKPSKGIACWMECKPSDRIMDHLFVRSGEVPAGSDPRLYDAAKLVIAVGGHSIDGVVLGELWNTYDLELILPKSSATQNPNQLQCFLTGSVISTLYPFTNGPLAKSSFYYNTFLLSWSTGTVLAWPKGYAGTYDIVFTWTCAGAISVAAALPGLAFAGGIYANTVLNTSGVGMTSAAGGCSFSVKYRISSNDKAATITATPGSFAIYGATTFTILVTQISMISLAKDSEIFDVRGINRSRKYKEMMNKVTLPKTSVDLDVLRFDSCFSLLGDPNTFQRFISIIGSDIKYPVPSGFPDTQTVKTWSDDTFDTICKGIIDRHPAFTNMFDRSLLDVH